MNFYLLLSVLFFAKFLILQPSLHGAIHLGKLPDGEINKLEGGLAANGEALYLEEGVVTVKKDNEVVADRVYAGIRKGKYSGADTQVFIRGAIMHSDIYGGNQEGVFKANSQLTLQSGSVTQIFAGSAKGEFVGNTKIQLEGGKAIGAAGGSTSGTFRGNSFIHLTGSATKSVVGGNYKGKFIGNAKIVVDAKDSSNEIIVVGGNIFNEFKGNVSIDVLDGNISFIVGGNLQDDDDSSTIDGFEGDISININGGDVNYFTGGTGSDFSGNITVTLNGGKLVNKENKIFSVGSQSKKDRDIRQERVALHLLKGTVANAHICMAGLVQNTKSARTNEVYTEITDQVSGTLQINGAYINGSMRSTEHQTLDFTSENANYSNLKITALNYDRVRVAKGSLVGLRIQNIYEEDRNILKLGEGTWLALALARGRGIIVEEGSLALGSIMNDKTSYRRIEGDVELKARSVLEIIGGLQLDGELHLHPDSVLKFRDSIHSFRLGSKGKLLFKDKFTRIALDLPEALPEKYKLALLRNVKLQQLPSNKARVANTNIELALLPNGQYGIRATMLFTSIKGVPHLLDAWIVWENNALILTNTLEFKPLTITWAGRDGEWLARDAWTFKEAAPSADLDIDFSRAKNVRLPACRSRTSIQIPKYGVRAETLTIENKSSYKLSGGAVTVLERLHTGTTVSEFSHGVDLSGARLDMEGSSLKFIGDTAIKRLRSNSTASLIVDGKLELRGREYHMFGKALTVNGDLIVNSSLSGASRGVLTVAKGKKLVVDGTLKIEGGTLDVSDLTLLQLTSRSSIFPTVIVGTVKNKELNINISEELLASFDPNESSNYRLLIASDLPHFEKLTLNGSANGVKINNAHYTIVARQPGGISLIISHIKPWPFLQL